MRKLRLECRPISSFTPLVYTHVYYAIETVAVSEGSTRRERCGNT